MPSPQEVVTVAQAAQELGVTTPAIRRAIQRGLLAAIRIDGRTNLIPRAEIEHYRREHQGRVGRPPKSATTRTTQQPAR